MSDYLTDEEQVDRLKKLWKDYGLTVVAALVIGIGAIVGWDYYKVYDANKAQAAADVYNSYLEASALGEPTAIFIEELESEFGSSVYFAFTLLREAKSAMDAGNFPDAHESLSKAYDVTEGTPIADLVALRKAKVEFELGEHDTVLATLQAIETSGYRWQALMMKGDVHFQADDLDSARDAYQSAKEHLPDGVDSELVDMRIASVPPAS